jgi:hypothetical protein
MESQNPARRPSTAMLYSSTLAELQLPNWLHFGLQSRSLTASKCILLLTQLQPPIAYTHSLYSGHQVPLQTRSITAFKWNFKLAQLWLPCSHNYGLHVHHPAQSFMASSTSLTSLDGGLRMFVRVHSIVIFRRTSKCSQARSAASPDSPCVDG